MVSCMIINFALYFRSRQSTYYNVFVFEVSPTVTLTFLVGMPRASAINFLTPELALPFSG